MPNGWRLGVWFLAGALAAAPQPAHPHEAAAARAGVAAARLADPALSAAPRLPVIKAAPDFELLDTAGQPVRLSDLRGRVVLLSFIYTSCSVTCPLVTQRIALLQGRLKREPAARFLSITVDPERDSTEALGGYATRFGADRGRWQFLREDPARLRPVLSAYDEWTRAGPNGEIDHPARLYLVDRRGSVREIYSLAFFDDRQAFLDIQALLKEARQSPDR